MSGPGVVLITTLAFIGGMLLCRTTHPLPPRRAGACRRCGHSSAAHHPVSPFPCTLCPTCEAYQ